MQCTVLGHSEQASVHFKLLVGSQQGSRVAIVLLRAYNKQLTTMYAYDMRALDTLACITPPAYLQ